eukprot:TRINITY_DN74039_c0_g1_i1.p1 TRINITY_DN74039_c0_g1~~TRINITY_DN74039_c0_g1_i1.p1  ORF type:complete len:348 (+),score=25.30 TRINITY_DN74039_c0_g1_i1:33-1046(+)
MVQPCQVCDGTGWLLREVCPLCEGEVDDLRPSEPLTLNLDAATPSFHANLSSLARRLRNGSFPNIIVCTGAGTSVKCGIPDFRSPGGLFEHIREDLGSRFPEVMDQPETALSRSFASNHPEEHDRLIRGQAETCRTASPSVCHYFLALLEAKGMLRRIYTQNVDGMHQRAGVSQEKVVEAHGSFTSHNLVLYGDDLPASFYSTLRTDFPDKDASADHCDLILVLGSSLQVAPFCGVPNLASRLVPRILVTKSPHVCFTNPFSKTTSRSPYDYSSCPQESCVKLGSRKVSLRPQWHGKSKYVEQHVFDEDVDNWTQLLARAAGWEDELLEIQNAHRFE